MTEPKPIRVIMKIVLFLLFLLSGSLAFSQGTPPGGRFDPEEMMLREKASFLKLEGLNRYWTQIQKTQLVGTIVLLVNVKDSLQSSFATYAKTFKY